MQSQPEDFSTVSQNVSPERMFLDKAQLLTLTAPEWVALVGGLRVLGANYDHSAHGVFTEKVGVLSNDFFKTVTSMDYTWQPVNDGSTFTLNRRDSGVQAFTATRCDLIFGANQQLRAVAEVYASNDGAQRFARDFVAVWNKVMMLDRFDTHA